MTRKPFGLAVVVLAIPTSSNVSVEIGATTRNASVNGRLSMVKMCDSLELRAVVVLRGTLANKTRSRRTHPQHTPILLEDTEVGRVAGFVVSW